MFWNLRFSLPIYLKTSFCMGVVLVLSACVPKTTYQDQQEKIKQLQTKVEVMESSGVECDKDVAVQLREQVQSLDLLQQELVDRNTELSKEVARLRVVESQAKAQEAACDKKSQDLREEGDGKMQRTRATYEDLIKELKAENQKLRDQLAAIQAAAEAAKTVKKPAPRSKPR
jgi:chromosome segregation ATPase